MKHLGILAGATIALGGAAALWFTKTETGYRQALALMYGREFPDVETLEPDTLQAMLAAPSPPVLLDIRSAEEYGVSHLRGARNLDPQSFAPSAVADLNRDSTVVVYCSVGVRSARMARRLRGLGFSHVVNLYGGIFLWYNQGREVVRNDAAVEAVHPYDFLWGQVITRGGKQYQP
jgi:rhodanese-related sulfurtransferase